MHLVQLLLPVQDQHGRPYSRTLYDDLVRRLKEQFGGVTAYTRASAAGLWEAPSGETVRDQIVVYEVMVEELDARWWGELRLMLKAKFAQQELVLRAQAIRKL